MKIKILLNEFNMVNKFNSVAQKFIAEIYSNDEKN